jgi:hypothetical protein
MVDQLASRTPPWPIVSYDEWRDTYETLHRWMQIVGKIRLGQAPWCNHSWHTTLYVTATGLTTGAMPYGARTFEIAFDFIGHQLDIRTGEGGSEQVPLERQSVATFYRRVMQALARLDLEVQIHSRPNEVADAIPFARDEVHAEYDADSANRFWQALVHADRVFTIFRGRFLGKASPVHFFWGAPDLAVTRFSGRPAPEHPGGIPNLPDTVAKEAYSHEVSSCGFWPGGGPIRYPVFYAYAYPQPDGFQDARVEPSAAFWSNELREFLLPYDAVSQSTAPDDTLLAFLQTTYAAAADRAGWDRAALERQTTV